MAETRRKFDEDFRQGAIEVARRDIRRARIGRSEIGGVAANERAHHCIQCSAGTCPCSARRCTAACS
jgi:hypothetical protein